MSFKSISRVLCALLSLSACSTPITNPESATGQPRQLSQLRAQQSIEQNILPARLEKHVAALSGASPIGPEGVIPERGSVEGRALARAYLTQSLEAQGYTVESHNYRTSGSNILARLMADNPSDEYIVLGAHLDSVRNAGANDNGTGSAAVLEAATVLKNLPGRKVNILFAWFDEEEIGLVGSRYLANDLRKQGLKITSMHNIDMLGWDGDKDKAIEVAQPDGILWAYYQMVNTTHGFNLPLERSNTGQSDHESFHKAGFDSVCISEEYTSGDLTPYYHRRGDTFETVNLEYLTRGTRFVTAVVGDLSLKVPAPIGAQFVPHDHFPAGKRLFHSSYKEAVHP